MEILHRVHIQTTNFLELLASTTITPIFKQATVHKQKSDISKAYFPNGRCKALEVKGRCYMGDRGCTICEVRQEGSVIISVHQIQEIEIKTMICPKCEHNRIDLHSTYCITCKDYIQREIKSNIFFSVVPESVITSITDDFMQLSSIITELVETWKTITPNDSNLIRVYVNGMYNGIYSTMDNTSGIYYRDIPWAMDDDVSITSTSESEADDESLEQVFANVENLIRYSVFI